jgi:hypothetical protein
MEDVMRKLKIAALVLLGTFSAGWMGVASAAPGDCAAELLALDAAIRDAEFVGTKATTDERARSEGTCGRLSGTHHM